MVDRARILLDRLMGKNRNVYDEGIKGLQKDMCIFSIAGLCPYEVFSKTKMDLGRCSYKIHTGKDKRLCKKEHEIELLKFLFEIHDYVKEQIDYKADTSDEITTKEKFIDSKIKEIRETVDKREALRLLDSLKPYIDELGSIKERFYVTNKDKSMTRCKVCGIKVIANYGSPTYKIHIKGKLHRGVKLVKDKLGELINKFGEEEVLKIREISTKKYFKK